MSKGTAKVIIERRMLTLPGEPAGDGAADWGEALGGSRGVPITVLLSDIEREVEYGPMDVQSKGNKKKRKSVDT